MCEYCDLGNFNDNKFAGCQEGPAYRSDDCDATPSNLKRYYDGEWVLECRGAMWEIGEGTVFFCPFCGRELD